MNYYIFVVNDQIKDGKTIKAQEIFDIRMQQKRWGLAERTANRKIIARGDKVIFYKAGSEGKQFLGYATIETKAEIKETDAETVLSIDNDYYKVELTNIQIFDTPKLISSFLNQLEFIQNIERWGAYFQGGTRKISEADFNLIIGTTTSSKISTPQNVTNDSESQTEFYLEKYLEDFIVTNWNNIDFGRNLSIFEDENGNIGQQYYTEEVGYIDILAQDSDGNFVVIELKKGRKNDEVVGQVLRYMGWVRKNLAKEDQEVRGLIIVGEKDAKLEYAVEMVSDKVNLKLYKIKFQLNEYR